MKHIPNAVLGIALALGLAVHGGAALAEAVVIVNPGNPVDALSAADVGRIYLGKTKSFPGGTRAEPVDQSAGSAIRGEFGERFLDMNEAQFKRHWSKLMFSGKGRPPVEQNGDDAVKAAVAANAGAIGYIDIDSVDDSVKVIDVTP